MTICSLTGKYSNIRSDKNSIHNFRDLMPADLIISFGVVSICSIDDFFNYSKIQLQIKDVHHYKRDKTRE